MLGTKNLSDILSEREGISKLMKVLWREVEGPVAVRYFIFIRRRWTRQPTRGV